MGNLIVKVLWGKEDFKLCSGFLVSKYKKDAISLKQEFEALLKRIANGKD